ncbi:putative immunity protein [Nocardiopsis coralliicola]
MGGSGRTEGEVHGDFTLTMAELRTVAEYVAGHGDDVLAVFERAVPGDPRPRSALDAARVFIGGDPRTKLQRTASLDAHRAARDAPDEAARLAAQAAGDAASAAYLHPLRRASQVGHILRAAACAARIAELGGGPEAAEGELERSRQRAAPGLVSVLHRYPAVPDRGGRVARLMHALDRALRSAA